MPFLFQGRIFLTPQPLKQQGFRKRVRAQGAGWGDPGEPLEPEEVFSTWPFFQRIINEHLLCVERRPSGGDTVGGEERGTNSRGAAPRGSRGADSRAILEMGPTSVMVLEAAGRDGRALVPRVLPPRLRHAGAGRPGRGWGSPCFPVSAPGPPDSEERF